MNKICYFNLKTFSKTGGIENFNKLFLRALDDISNEMVTSVSVYDNISDSTFKNIDFKNFNKNKLHASLFVLKNIFKIDQLILAHINLLPVAIIAKIIKPNLKIYLTIYGLDVWKKLPFIYRLFLKSVHILSISNYTTEIFKKYNGGKYNISYLPPSINLSLSNENIEINPFDISKFNILSVCRLEKDSNFKGVDSMLKSIPLLLKSIPNIKYTIIGKGNDKERLEKLAIKLGVMEYIDFKGFVNSVDVYYKYCDLFSLPSKREGFGIVYAEAMKYKKPCIACFNGGQTDIIINKKTGLLCKYDNLNDISNKIISLYKDKQLSEELGIQGYTHLIDNFTFDKFKNNLLKILKDE